MKSTLFALVSTALFLTLKSVPVLADVPTLNTPLNVVVCEPVQFSWTGGTGPFFLTLHPGADANGAAILDFGTLNGQNFLWPKVTFPAGTSLDATLKDSNGAISQTAPFTVQAGADTSCLNGAGASSGAGATTAATTAAKSSVSTGASATSPAATSANKGSTSLSSGPTVSTSSSAAKTTSSSNAAVAISGVYGAAGVVGAVVAAVLA